MRTYLGQSKPGREWSGAAVGLSSYHTPAESDASTRGSNETHPSTIVVAQMTHSDVYTCTRMHTMRCEVFTHLSPSGKRSGHSIMFADVFFGCHTMLPSTWVPSG